MTTAATSEYSASTKFNSSFRVVNNCRLRYRILKGSAGSGKSVNIAQDYIAKLSDLAYEGANLLVVRKIEETNRDSTFAELRSAIYKMFGPYADYFWKVTLNPLSLECSITGSKIIFRGVKDQHQREKVKSITFKQGKLTWIWIEEATELLAEDIDILDDRLRGKLDTNPNLFYQITMTFNPVSAAHWIKNRYFDKSDPDTLTHHSTYRQNHFIDSAYFKRMERRALEDPEGYRVYGLGEWGELGGLILTDFEVHDFPTGKGYFDSFYYGQDFGYNHANALLGVGFKDGDVYIASELYVHEKDTGEIIALARGARIDPHVEMFCDCAEPDRIKTWAKAGFRACAVKKEAGSVKAQIDWLKGRKLHIHPACQYTLKEISQWKWKKDSSSGLYIDEPVEFMDDAMAALRYAVERVRKGSAIQVFK